MISSKIILFHDNDELSSKSRIGQILYGINLNFKYYFDRFDIITIIDLEELTVKTIGARETKILISEFYGNDYTHFSLKTLSCTFYDRVNRILYNSVEMENIIEHINEFKRKKKSITKFEFIDFGIVLDK